MPYNSNDNTSWDEVSHPSRPDYWTAPEPHDASGPDDVDRTAPSATENSLPVSVDSAWTGYELGATLSAASHIPSPYFIQDLQKPLADYALQSSPGRVYAETGLGYGLQASAHVWKPADLEQASTSPEGRPNSFFAQPGLYHNNATMPQDESRRQGSGRKRSSTSSVDPHFLLDDEHWPSEQQNGGEPAGSSYTGNFTKTAPPSSELSSQCYDQPWGGYVAMDLGQINTNVFEPWTTFSAGDPSQPRIVLHGELNSTYRHNSTSSFHTSDYSQEQAYARLSSGAAGESTDTSFDRNTTNMEDSGYTAMPATGYDQYNTFHEPPRDNIASTESASHYQDALGEEMDLNQGHQHDSCTADCENRPEYVESSVDVENVLISSQ